MHHPMPARSGILEVIGIRRSRGELVKAVALGLGYAFCIFWVAVYREMAVENKTFFQAALTGAWLSGAIVVVFWVLALIIWTNKSK